MSWAVVGQLSYETEAGPLRENEDGSFNVSSRLRLTGPRLEAGMVVTCLVQHLTGTGSVSERFPPIPRSSEYYFILLSLILIVPICVWIVYNYHSKLKKGKESSVHDATVDIQSMRKQKNSVNEDNVSINNENLHYAPVYFNKGQRRQELRWTEQSQETEYAVLKVKDKNNL
ncbi:tyrosine-protein phosphatase non-receptor type substrate 1-like [Leucoraja erinacea]|uniref:tyrosine-protein phosphatase non-receptor type substrate 1-like n=1 Tax=Leucoraja erinaceus TaxID=7782 RepID=UPI0024574FB9|nr:tyrosine-protein phosphatase non-receptor type substrate 1-like [Leucoraja erinacea]